MIQAESRDQRIEEMYKGHQITVTFRIADHHKSTLTISLIDHRTQNHYFVQHTFETLPSIAKKCFKNVRQLYEKLLESIEKDNGDLVIEPNGVLILKHMRKDRKCQSYVTIKTKLKQMNILTDSNQAIQLLFEKAKQNRDFVYQMKKLISNEVKESLQKQSKKNQDQLQIMRNESSVLKRKIQKLQKEISERCLKSQMTQTVKNIDTALKGQISNIKNELSLKCLKSQMIEKVKNIDTALKGQISNIKNELSLKCLKSQMIEKVKNIDTALKGQISNIKNELSLKCLSQMTEKVKNIDTALKGQISNIKNELSLKCLKSQMIEKVKNIDTALKGQISNIKNELSLKCLKSQMIEKVKNIDTALKIQIQKLQKEISEKCLRRQMNAVVQYQQAELRCYIQDLRHSLGINYEQIRNIQTKFENIDRTIPMLQKKLDDTNARLAKIKN